MVAICHMSIILITNALVIFVAIRHRRLYCTRLRTPLLIACRMHRVVAVKCFIPVSNSPFPRLNRTLPTKSPWGWVPLVSAESIVLTLTFYGYQLTSFRQLLICLWTMDLPLLNIVASCAAGASDAAAADALAAAALRRFFAPFLPSIVHHTLAHPWNCLHVRFWALLTFGLALPLTATSLSEEHSRQRFLEENGEVVLKPPVFWTIVHAGACMALFSATLWALGEAVGMLAAVPLESRS